MKPGRFTQQQVRVASRVGQVQIFGGGSLEEDQGVCCLKEYRGLQLYTVQYEVSP